MADNNSHMCNKSVQVNIIKSSSYIDNNFIKYNKETLQEFEKDLNLKSSFNEQARTESVQEWMTNMENQIENEDYKQLFRPEETEYKEPESPIERNTRFDELDDLIISEEELNMIEFQICRARSVNSKSYALWEQREILKFILINKYEDQVGGNKIWKELEKSSEYKLNRTWQSLKNHYNKHLTKNPLLLKLIKKKGRVILFNEK